MERTRPYAALLCLLLAATPAAARAQRADTVMTVPHTGRLEVVGVLKGTVTLRPGGTDSVGIRIRRSPGIRVEVKASPRVVEIQTFRPARLALEDVDVEVLVPAETDVYVIGRQIDVHATGLSGSLELRSAGGSVSGTELSGTVIANSTTGDVTMTRTSGSLTIDATAGQVRVLGGEGSLRAESVGGDITVEDAAFASAELTTTYGTIRYTGRLSAEGRYDLASQDGAVELTYASGLAGAAFDVGTVSGPVELPTALGASPDVTGRVTRLSFGSGGPEVRIVTFSGAIRVRERPPLRLPGDELDLHPRP